MPFFARLAYNFEKVLISPKFVGSKKVSKKENFMLISNQMKKFLKNAPKKLKAKQV